MRFVAGRGAGGDGAKRKSLPIRGCRCGTIGKRLPLRGRTFGSAAVLREMVILNLLVVWREPVVYHSVYVLLNDGFEEGILLGQ